MSLFRAPSPKRKMKSQSRPRMRTWIERLEQRDLLASDIESVLWKGEQVEAYAGDWVLRLNGLSGGAESQIKIAQSLIDQAAPSFDATITRKLALDGMFEITTAANVSKDQVTSFFAGLTGFGYIEPDFVLTRGATIPDDPQFTSLYGLNNTGLSGGTADADIDAPEVWDLTTGSSQIVVGVIDTGIDYTHPDLAANIWVNPGETPGDGIDNDGNGYIDDIHGWDFAYDDNDPMDIDGHGTHVAGTIGAVGNNGIGVAGVNWNVKLMALKFLNDNGRGSSADAVDALYYAAIMKQLYGVNIRVTNNSWGGGGYSTALRDAIDINAQVGILYVAAAGNYNTDNDAQPFYPATYEVPNVISVAATDNRDQKASFSNYGATTVDLGAPGVSIRSTVPGGGYANYSGTSMASPHVAGVAALAFSVAPNASYEQVKNAILSSVDLIPSMSGITVTGGRLNAYGAVVAMGLQVAHATPGGGESVSVAPTTFTIKFSSAVVESSVDADDLLVNGVAANHVSVNGDTAVFTYDTSPVSVEGPQTIQILADKVLRASDNDGNDPYGGSFYYDLTPLEVVSVLTPSGTPELPIDRIIVRFNEAVAPGTIDVNDLRLSRGRVVGVEQLDDDEIAFDLSDIVGEGPITVSIDGGRVFDLFGSPNVAFTSDYDLDFGVVPYPIPLDAIAPNGSLIRDPAVNGSIGVSGDVDTFTLSLLAGQTISVVLDPESTLRGTVRVLDPTGVPVASQTGAGPGANVVIQNVATVAGVYKVEVSGASGSTGGYSVQVVLNAAIEEETHFGGDNSTRAGAQNIDGSFIDLPGGISRGGVLGVGDDIFSFRTAEDEPNNTTATADDAAGSFQQGPAERYQLAIKGTVGASADEDWYRIGTLQVGDILTITESGSPSSRGSLSDPIVYLYRGSAASPVLVTSNDDNGPGLDSLILRRSITVADTYYLRAKADNTGTGTYDLAAWLENTGAAPLTGDLTFGETESNNTAATATDASARWRKVDDAATLTAQSGGNDVDVYRYVFHEGDVITIEADSSAASLPLTATLLNASGVALASDVGSTGRNGDAVIVGYRIAASGEYFVQVSGGAAPVAGYTLRVYLSSATAPPAPTTGDDFYSITLNAGDVVSLVATNLSGLGAATVELQDTNGVVLATGDSASNANSLIDPVTVESTGQYYVRVRAGEKVAYSMVVVKGAVFEREPNGAVGDPVSLDDVGGAVGWLNANRPVIEGPVVFTIDPNLSSIVLSGGAESGGDTVPILEQAPGSLFSAIQGTIGAIITADGIRFNGTSAADPVGQSGLFLPGNQSGDYAGRIDILPPSIIAYGIFRNMLFNASSALLPFNELGQYTASGINLTITTGSFVYDVPNVTSGTEDLAGVGAPNQTAALGRYELFDDYAQVTIPVYGEAPFSSFGINIVGRLTGQVVATIPRLPPIDPSDEYDVFLEAGQTLTLEAHFPFAADSAAGASTLDVRMTLRDSSGTPVNAGGFSDADGDSRFAFTPSQAGRYRILVEAASGEGDYVLTREIANAAPVAHIAGPTQGVRGQELAFQFSASDFSPIDQANDFTYDIDWDGDGAVDETLVGPGAGVTATQVFEDVGVHTIRVTATDSQGATSAIAAREINVVAYALVANGDVMDLVIGGMAGSDFYSFWGLGGRDVGVIAGGDLGVFRVDGVTGKIVVFMQGGDDTVTIEAGMDGFDVEAHLGAGLNMFAAIGGSNSTYTVLGGDDADQFYLVGGGGITTFFQGGGGNDVYLDVSGIASNVSHVEGGQGDDGAAGGLGADYFDGGDGNDMLVGGFTPIDGDDTLIGGAGDDFLVGGTGADALDGGDNQDLIVSGSLVFLPVVTDGYLPIWAEWGASGHGFASRIENIANAAPAPDRLNGDYFILIGETALDDEAIDTLLGGADEDVLLGSFAQDLAPDYLDGFDFAADLGA